MNISQKGTAETVTGVKPRGPVPYWLLESLRDREARFSLTDVTSDEMTLLVRAWQGDLELLEQQLLLKQCDYNAWMQLKTQVDTIALYLRLHYSSEMAAKAAQHQGSFADCITHYLGVERKLHRSLIGRVALWWVGGSR